MSKSIKVLFLFLIISLFYKSPVLACAPGFPEYIYDSTQILDDYYPLIKDIGSTDIKKNPILNNKFEVIAPIWGPEYMLGIYFSAINKNPPENIKKAWVNYINDRNYYYDLKRSEFDKEISSVDSPVSSVERLNQSFWQKFLSFIDDIFNKNKSPEEMEKEYKLAADEYHRGNYDQAISLFSRIYKNKKHLNRDKAALSLGWSYIAKANLQYEIDLKNKSKNAESDLIKNLKTAQKYYEKIINDQSLSEVKLEIDKYYDYVLYRTDPVLRLTRAGKAMLETNDEKEFLRNLNDYIKLWYKYFYRHIVYDKEVPEYKEFSQKIKDSDDKFSKFLIAWTDLNTNTSDQNISNYKETHLPIWLVLSQRQIDTNNKQWSYINDEISKIKDDSPFYLTAQYYNLLAKSKEIKNKESIKPIIDNLISQTNNSQQFIAQNLFNDLMFNLTDSIMEKQKYSLMNIVDFYWTEWDSISFPPYYQYLNESNIYKEKQYFLSYKMKEMLVKTDINKLNDFLSNENIFNPKNKQYLRLGLYVKSILNNRFDISKNMSQLLAKNNALLAKDLSAFNRSQNTEEQKFLAAKFILDYPGITDVNSQSFDEFSVYNVENIKEIDNYRRNWDFEDDCVMYGYPDYYEEKDKTKELKIDSKDLLTNIIGEIVINYATKNPDHELVPEALSKVVDLVHYGSCADKQSPEYAKRSFQFLHSNYPNSYWAKQTPYWYEY